MCLPKTKFVRASIRFQTKSCQLKRNSSLQVKVTLNLNGTILYKQGFYDLYRKQKRPWPQCQRVFWVVAKGCYVVVKAFQVAAGALLSPKLKEPPKVPMIFRTIDLVWVPSPKYLQRVYQKSWASYKIYLCQMSSSLAASGGPRIDAVNDKFSSNGLNWRCVCGPLFDVFYFPRSP